MLGPVAAAVLVWVGPETQDVPVTQALAVEPGATCLQHDELAQHLEMWLEREHVDAGIEVTVTGDPDDPRAATFVIARDGQAAAPRRLDGIPDDCGSLHAAVALAIAVAVDASVGEAFVAPGPEPEAEAAAEAEGAREPEPDAQSGPEPAPQPEPTAVLPKLRLVTRFGGTVALGLTDGPAYGGSAGVTVRLPSRIDVDLGVGGLVGPHGSLAGARVRTSVAYGMAGLCVRLEPTQIRACVRAAAGGQDVQGRSAERTRVITLPYVVLGPGIDVAVPRDTPVGFVAGLELWAPVLRTRLTGLGDDGEVLQAKRVPPVGASASIGVVFRVR